MSKQDQSSPGREGESQQDPGPARGNGLRSPERTCPSPGDTAASRPLAGPTPRTDAQEPAAPPGLSFLLCAPANARPAGTRSGTARSPESTGRPLPTPVLRHGSRRPGADPYCAAGPARHWPPRGLERSRKCRGGGGARALGPPRAPRQQPQPSEATAAGRSSSGAAPPCSPAAPPPLR